MLEWPHAKVGDRVRCTLGDSVLVGRVTQNSPKGISVRPDGAIENNRVRPPWAVVITEAFSTPPSDEDGALMFGASGAVYKKTPEGWIEIDKLQ